MFPGCDRSFLINRVRPRVLCVPLRGVNLGQLCKCVNICSRHNDIFIPCLNSAIGATHRLGLDLIFLEKCQVHLEYPHIPGVTPDLMILLIPASKQTSQTLNLNLVMMVQQLWHKKGLEFYLGKYLITWT